MKFSIVVPTYNEQDVIGTTLDCLVGLSYPNKEVIVVDDSTDKTPEFVQAYSDRNVILVKPERRAGRCEARNLGIHHASGDVIIILNADVLLPNDFIERIKVHYDNGYDAVSVMNLVSNVDNLYARYIGMHNYRKKEKGVFEERKIKLKNLWWTEGFSARAELIRKTSLFPTGFSVPICAGEDVRFVDELRSLGAKGIFDESIVIKHIAPDNLKEYWQIRKGRGAGTPQIRRFLDKWSYQKIGLVATLRFFQFLLRLFLVFPMVHYNYHLAKFSDKNTFFETIRFTYPWFLERLAISVGEFESLKKIIKAEKK